MADLADVRGMLSYHEVELVRFCVCAHECVCVCVCMCSRQCEKRVIGSPVPGCRLMGRWGEWKPDGEKERWRKGSNECTE